MAGLTSASFDRAAQQTNDFLSRFDPRLQNMEPIADPFQQGAFHSQDFGNASKLRMGRIVAAMPELHWYAVKLADCGGDVPCCALAESGFGAMGVRSSGSLQTGVSVWVVLHPCALTGYILGVIPPKMSDSKLVFSDWIVQGPGCGFQKEKYYKDLPRILAEGELTNFNAGRPLGATASGEWGRFSETGLGFHLDAFMAFMRVSEMCGVWAFYHDELLRIAGRNLDVRSAGHEIVARDDEGEFQYEYGDTGYPWEADGALKFGAKNFRETDDEKVVTGAIFAKYEPTNDDQMPFYRYGEHGGYLGQGRHRFVVAPPRQTGTWRYGDTDKLQGLWSEHVAYTGQYGMQSAKGFSFVKRPCIVIGKRKKLAEDGSEGADNKTNYKAAGQQGAGKEHKLKEFKNTGEYPQVKSVAAILDLHAHAFNWQRLHPYHYHEKDFDTPAEDELPTLKKQQSIIEFGQLQSEMWLPQPQPKKLKIDHRTGEINYFENMAGWTVTDDGGQAWFDGYGSSMVMTGGNIILAPAGNLILQPGKSLVALAGDDVCLRAVNSVDVTAGKKDVRIKAEKNMQFLSGNGGQGGMLFESKSSGTTQKYAGKVGEDVEASGIIFKAENSPIGVISRDVYLRSLQGRVVIDANKGKSDVVLIGKDVINYAESEILHYFGFDTTDSANRFSRSQTYLAGQLGVLGQIVADGSMQLTGAVAALGGFAAQTGPSMVGKLDDTAVSAVQDSVSILVESSEEGTTAAQGLRTGSLEQDYYAEQKPGNDTFQQQGRFSFRNEKQYGTEKFTLPMAYWQQLAREQGAGTAWDEPTVDYQGEQQLPWPGKKKWKDEPTLLNTKLTLFDLSGGTDKPRGSIYEEPELGEWQKLTPSSGFLVIPSS